MEVFKFGGGTMYDDVSLNKVLSIVKYYLENGHKFIVVVSAMGHTTRFLKRILNEKKKRRGNYINLISELCDYHKNILKNVDISCKDRCFSLINEWGNLLYNLLNDKSNTDIDDYQFFHSFIANGELLSSKLFFELLKDDFKAIYLADSRHFIKVHVDDISIVSLDWDNTKALIYSYLIPLFDNHNMVIVQGFIGSNNLNLTVTLGDESSDFTAAIIASIANSDTVVLWKSVPGIMTDDPALVSDATKIASLTYNKMLSILNQGARVVHPSTITVLEKAQIPLHIKSINNPFVIGTLVR